ncbi:MAG: hypothetical protein ACPG05_03705 [Bdellovibrionales bacterium]
MVDQNVYIEELSKQKNKISDAITQMDNGQLPNMQEIDRDVVTLCGAIESAPPEIARQAEQGLREMISMLEELASRIQDFQNSLEQK